MTHDSSPPNAKVKKAAKTLLSAALGYPEAWEDHPWGETAIKVRKKVFLFLMANGEGLSLSLKLSESAQEALLLPFTEPTGYGLGKSGWVSAKFDGKEAPPVSLILPWIDESYRAVAPKTLVRTLDAD